MTQDDGLNLIKELMEDGFTFSDESQMTKLLTLLDEAGIEHFAYGDRGTLGKRVYVRWGDAPLLVSEMLVYDPDNSRRPLRYLEAKAMLRSPEELVDLVKAARRPNA